MSSLKIIGLLHFWGFLGPTEKNLQFTVPLDHPVFDISLAPCSAGQIFMISLIRSTWMYFTFAYHLVLQGK